MAATNDIKPNLRKIKSKSIQSVSQSNGGTATNNIKPNLQKIRLKSIHSLTWARPSSAPACNSILLICSNFYYPLCSIETLLKLLNNKHIQSWQPFISENRFINIATNNYITNIDRFVILKLITKIKSFPEISVSVKITKL